MKDRSARPGGMPHQLATARVARGDLACSPAPPKQAGAAVCPSLRLRGVYLRVCAQIDRGVASIRPPHQADFLTFPPRC
ncbi:hypothetical protein AAFF_G00167180 [Aldrovandia affinis]|uniref:Uncharacterized protein n=1 Tax=Aldrovandia affinis TaxID=143900 RepID=A0AAD7RM90_9TELE|nr:hypothetical protein AAFF_G00167180 [Aldrovandia affinis]